MFSPFYIGYFTEFRKCSSEEYAVTLFGVCLIPLGVVQYIAGYWTWQNKWHGIILARFIGILIFFDGFTLYMILHRPDLAFLDMVKGIIISLIAFTSKRD